MLAATVWTTASILVLSVCADEAAVPLSPFTVQLKSKAKPEGGGYLVQIRYLTEGHLENKITETLSDRRTNGEVFDSPRVELLMKSFTFSESTGNRNRNFRRNLQRPSKYVSTATFKGSAFFDSESLPCEDVLYDIQHQAFSGVPKKELLRNIQTSDDTFLAEADEISIIFAAIQNRATGSTKRKGRFLPLLPTAIGASVGVILTFFGAYTWYKRKRNGPLSLFEEPKESKIKSKQTDICKIEVSSTKSPSPPPSIGSMDSSKFTYNEGASTRKSDKSSKSTKSCCDTINLNMNVDAWRNGQLAATSVAPFAGDDISVIQKSSPQKTVVLQSSDDCSYKKEQHKFRGKASVASTKPEGVYLSKESLSKLNNKAKFQRHTPKYHGRMVKLMTGASHQQMSVPIFADDSTHGDETNGSIFSDGSDVINDLKNLSAQINKHRSSA